MLSGFCERREGDGVSEGFELADGAGCHFGGGPAGEVVGSWVPVELSGGEHVPGGGEHGVFDGDEGFGGSAPGGDAPVFGREVGVV